MGEVQIAERIRADVNSAMKAGDRDRAAALRLVLSELQKDAKDCLLYTSPSPRDRS